MVAQRMQPPSNRPLLLQDLARHERQPEELTVRVSERCAGFATVVDDGLRVTDVLARSVLLQTPTEHLHHLRRVVVGELVRATVVVGRVDEHLVDAAGVGLHVHRTEVVHGERLVAVERRVQVGDEAHPPVAAVVERLERGEGGLFVARAERARTIGLGLHLRRARGEVGGTLGPVGDNGDPPARQGVQA
jgi:hypothetical protein